MSDINYEKFKEHDYFISTNQSFTKELKGQLESLEESIVLERGVMALTPLGA